MREAGRNGIIDPACFCVAIATLFEWERQFPPGSEWSGNADKADDPMIADIATIACPRDEKHGITAIRQIVTTVFSISVDPYQNRFFTALFGSQAQAKSESIHG